MSARPLDRYGRSVIMLRIVCCASSALLFTHQRICTALLCALVSASVHAGAAQPEVQGCAVAIGGALRYDNAPVWSRLVALAGGRKARFVVFATAAGDPEASAERIIEVLQSHGAQAVHIPVAPQLAGLDLAAEVRRAQWIELVDQASGVFFSGGAQERIVDTLLPRGEPTPLLQAVHRAQARGALIAGTSAGAAVMSRVMFRDAQDVMSVLRGALREGVEIDRGLGFVAPALFIDQHFLARGRLGRMLPLMIAKGYRFGLGVEEDSAAIVCGEQIEVIGAKGALLVDLKDAQHDAAVAAFNLRNARLTYLDRGDRIDLASGVVSPAAVKLAKRLDPQAPDFKPYYDEAPFVMNILGEGAVLAAMTNLLDSPAPEVRGLAYDGKPTARGPLGFEFRFYKQHDTSGWFTSAYGGEDYTVINVHLDVSPVRMAQPLYTAWPTPQSGSHSSQP